MSGFRGRVFQNLVLNRCRPCARAPCPKRLPSRVRMHPVRESVFGSEALLQPSYGPPKFGYGGVIPQKSPAISGQGGWSKKGICAYRGMDNREFPVKVKKLELVRCTIVPGWARCGPEQLQHCRRATCCRPLSHGHEARVAYRYSGMGHCGPNDETLQVTCRHGFSCDVLGLAPLRQ